jgi:hypothetical protein
MQVQIICVLGIGDLIYSNTISTDSMEDRWLKCHKIAFGHRGYRDVESDMVLKRRLR